MTRKLLLNLVALLALSIAAPAAASANDVSGVILQAWYWDSPVGAQEQWWNKLSRMMPRLRSMGITALWIPPPTKAAGGGYSSGYDLYDFYDLGSKDQRGTVPTKWGTKENLLKLIAIAHANGLDVYSDIVVNHRAGGDSGGYSYQNLVGSETTGRLTMAPWDFHPKDWHGDVYEAVGGMPDIAQGVPYVRDELYKWIRWFDKQTGVDGYRIDAVKHMTPEFIEGMMWQVQEGMNKSSFAVGELYDGNPNTLGWWVNAAGRRSSVFDFTSFFELLSMAHGNGYYDMRQLRTRFYDYEKSVTFCNNHDTFRRANGLHLYQRSNLAHAWIMAAAGYPSVYWLDLFEEGTEDSRYWMENLIWIHHHLAKGNQIERWADQDLMVIEREGNLLAGFNDNTTEWRAAWVRTGFGPNVRLHDYALGVGDVWTNEHGYARIAVPPSGYVMYGRDGMQGKQPNPPARRTRQEFEGAPDMDMRPAYETWSDPVRFVSEQGQPMWITAWFKDPTLTGHVALFDDQGNLVQHADGKGQVSFSVQNPAKAGWYQVRVALEQTAQGTNRSNYWLELDYQGPKTDPGAAPSNTQWQLPSLAASPTP